MFCHDSKRRPTRFRRTVVSANHPVSSSSAQNGYHKHVYPHPTFKNGDTQRGKGMGFAFLVFSHRANTEPLQLACEWKLRENNDFCLEWWGNRGCESESFTGHGRAVPGSAACARQRPEERKEHTCGKAGDGECPGWLQRGPHAQGRKGKVWTEN